MTGKRIAQHQAVGDLTATAVHLPGGSGLTDVMSVRWLDSAGSEGQSTRAELVNLIAERGGRVFIRDGDEARPLEPVQMKGIGVLRTQGTDQSGPDPLLELPRY